MRFTIFLTVWACLPLSLAAQRTTPGQASRPGWPCAGKVDPAFVRTAEATGGTVLLFHPSEVEGAALDDRASRQHEETILRAAGQLDGESYEFSIPIDSTVESAYVSVSVQCLHSVTLLTPTGEELSAGAAGVEYHQFEALRMFVVPKPAPGTWKAMNGPARQAAFSFVAANGAPIGAVQLGLESESADRRIYRGPAIKPPSDFRLAVSGVDSSGFRFQRMERRLSLGEAIRR